MLARRMPARRLDKSKIAMFRHIENFILADFRGDFYDFDWSGWRDEKLAHYSDLQDASEVVCCDGKVIVYLDHGQGKMFDPLGIEKQKVGQLIRCDDMYDLSALGITKQEVGQVIRCDDMKCALLDRTSEVIREELGMPKLNYKEEANRAMKENNIIRLEENPRVFVEMIQGPRYLSLSTYNTKNYNVYFYAGLGEAKRDSEETEKLGTCNVIEIEEDAPPFF